MAVAHCSTCAPTPESKRRDAANLRSLAETMLESAKKAESEAVTLASPSDPTTTPVEK